MHHYKHNIGDYRRRTSHLSLLEHGVYRQLMDTYYLDEEAIPNETNLVFRRLVAKTDEEKSAVKVVLKEFFELRDGAWHHAHCDEVIAKYQGNAETSRTNGKLGGRPPKEPGNNQPGSKKKPTQKATNNQKPKTKNHSPASPGVEVSFDSDFWPVYPRKVGKPLALKSFAKALARAELPAIIAGLDKHLPYWAAKIKAGDGDKVPHPSTWLNRDGWNDDVPTVAGAAPEKEWHETKEGIIAKAHELGHAPYDELTPFPAFAGSVKRMAGVLKGPGLGLEELMNMKPKG